MKIDLTNKFKNYHTDNNDNWGETLETLSINGAIEQLIRIKHNCELNGLDSDKTPLFVLYDNELHLIKGSATCHGDLGTFGTIDVSKGNRFHFVAPDIEDPASTDVIWKSRGVSDGLDVSGFVNSRPSGLRLLHMVQDILGKEETISHLDYREKEPNWIQFKFYPKEFDVYMIDKLSKEAGEKLNKEILAKCKI